MGIDWDFMWEMLPELVSVLPVTIELSVVALLLSLPASLLFAFILLKEIPFLSKAVKFYISLLRGTPVILQMYVIYLMLPSLLQNVLSGHGVDVFSVPDILYAFFALSLYPTAFLTEAFRSSILSVSEGQWEAGAMAGLKQGQIFFRIIFPQAMSVAVPILGNIIIDTIKATSLAFTMSVTEVMGKAKILGGMSLKYFEMYLDVFFVYVIFIGMIDLLLKWAEKKNTLYKGV